jgi:hypothetical protein
MEISSETSSRANQKERRKQMAPKKKPGKTPTTPNDPDKSLFRHPMVVTIVGGIIAGIILLVVQRVWSRFDGIDTRLGTLDTEVGKLKQAIADGGTREIVSQLEKAKSPLVVAAQMSLISAQVHAAIADGKKPNQEKISALAPAIGNAAGKYPDLPETWSAVSTLVNYRTSEVNFPDGQTTSSLPDCDIDKPETLFYPEDMGFPKTPITGTKGYLFQNCKLYLDRLPGHRQVFHIKDNSDPNAPGQAGDVGVIGVLAYAINVVVVWRGTFSDTDILSLTTRNCKFEFEVNKVPSQQGQNLLLAALESPQPGSGVFSLKRGMDSPKVD